MNLISPMDEEESDDEDGDDKKAKKKKAQKYRPPKIAAEVFRDTSGKKLIDNTHTTITYNIYSVLTLVPPTCAALAQKEKEQSKKKKALTSALARDIIQEFGNAPEEVYYGGQKTKIDQVGYPLAHHQSSSCSSYLLSNPHHTR